MNVSNETIPDAGSDISFSVGVSYIMAAVIFIPLHIVCSYLMYTDKDMKNATYQFMINLSIADIFELTTVGLYAGSVLITKVQPMALEHWVLLVLVTCWFVNCVLFVFIAFSRWVTITRSHMVPIIFKKRTMWFMHVTPWVFFISFYFYGCIFANAGFFVPSLFTWAYNTATPYGLYLHWHNAAFNSTCAITEIVFNALSLHTVHKMRKSVKSVSTAENQRREIKLLVQCFVLGLVFMLTEVLFVTIITNEWFTPSLLLGMQFTWTANHCLNPLVYLTVNGKLRRRLVRLLTCGKLIEQKDKTTVVHVSIGVKQGTDALSVGAGERRPSKMMTDIESQR